MSFIRSCLCSFFTDDAHEVLLDGDGDGRNGFGDDDDRLGSPEQDSNRLALYDAADRMEGAYLCNRLLELQLCTILVVYRYASLTPVPFPDPDIQAKMQDILESDPDKLAEAIEADPELRALRDSNPLCAELMKEPETMKILTEPDNLRAFADAPELIEQDFANPDWSPPDVEEGQYNDGYRLGDVEADDEGNGLLDDYEVGENAQEDQGGMFDDYEVGENAQEDQGGMFDDYEVGENAQDDQGGILDDYEAGEIGGEEEGGFLDGYEEGELEDDAGFLDEVEAGEDIEAGPTDLDNYDEDGFENELKADESSPRDETGNNNDAGETAEVEQEVADRKKTSSKGRQSKKQRDEDDDDDEGNSGGGATRGFLGALGAGLVDYVAAETIGVSASAIFGGDEEDELAEALNDVEGGLEEQADRVETMADQAAAVAEVATGDEIAGNLEDTLDTVEGAHDMAEPAAESSTQRQEPKASGSNSQGSSKPQSSIPTGTAAAGAGAGAGIMAVGSRFLSSLNTAAKEYVASAVLGDDMGEALVERLEEGGDEDGEEEDGEFEAGSEDGDGTRNTSQSRPTITSRSEPIEEQDFNGSVEL